MSEYLTPESFLESEDPDQERDKRLAGIIARYYEEQGLIQPTDEFSFEWHSMFDNEIEAIQTDGAQGAMPNVPGFNFGGDFDGNF